MNYFVWKIMKLLEFKMAKRSSTYLYEKYKQKGKTERDIKKELIEKLEKAKADILNNLDTDINQAVIDLILYARLYLEFKKLDYNKLKFESLKKAEEKLNEKK